MAKTKAVPHIAEEVAISAGEAAPSSPSVPPQYLTAGAPADMMALDLRAWARSKPAELLMKAIEAHSSANASKIGAAISAAKKAFETAGLPGAALAPVGGGGYAREGQKNNLALDLAFSETGAAEALKEVQKAGIDPWIVIERARAEPKTKTTGHRADYEDYIEYSYRVAAGGDLGKLAMGVGVAGYGDYYGNSEITTRAASAAFIALVLEHAPKYPASAGAAFCAALVKEFTKAHGEALQGAAGVMGAKDKRARLCAELLIGAQAGLLAVAGKSRGAVEAALEEAGRFKSAKKAKPDFDPAKYKKALAPEKRERLQTIANLLERSHSDPGCAAVIARSSSWIAEEPHSLCVPLRGSCSALHNALMYGEAELVAFAEEVGANIWIAAAQAGESNACQWACQIIGDRGSDKLSASVARMLAWGAHLDGAADPVDYALKKLDAAKIERGYGQSAASGKQVISGMRAQIEAIIFENMLKERAAADKQAGIEPAPAPARRRNAL